MTMGRQSDSLSTDPYFLLEWVTGIFYGSRWHDVREGTLKEQTTSRGKRLVYVDQYTDEIIFLEERVTGFKIKQREFRPVVVDSEY